MSRSSKPLILVSNDDGIEAEGIQCLAASLSRLGRVVLVAPEREQSTMGHALTLHKPVRLKEGLKSTLKLPQWSVSGTPADCVYLALKHLLKEKPALIVSGVNNGANLGNDFFYSGTVAAAREGALLGIPALATSLACENHSQDKRKRYFKDAADYACQVAGEILKNGIPAGTLLNLNYPNLPKSQVKGTRVSSQGFRFYANKTHRRLDPRGKDYFWLGGLYRGFQKISGSDCVAIDEGYIALTPCRLDVTEDSAMQELKGWSLKPRKAKALRKKKD